MNDGWKEYKLDDVAEIVGGGTPSTKNSSYFYGNIAWITPKDLSGYTSRYISCGERYISQEGLENSSAKLLPKDTVLLTTRAPIGYVAIAKNVITTNQGFRSLIVKEGFCPEYIYYLLKSNTEILKSHSSGTTFGELSGSALKRLKFILPPLPEQKAIAAILGALDDKIELNRKMNETLESMAQALFKSWFIDFDPVKAKVEGRKPVGMDEATAKLFPSEFVDSKLGKIPKGWEVSELSKIVNIVDCLHSKKPLRVESGKPLLQLWNIRDDGLLDMNNVYWIAEEDYYRWISRIEVKQFDCVITNVGRVGAVAQIPKTIKAAMGRNMTALQYRSEFPFPTFIIRCLLSDFMKQEIVTKIDTGTILEALNVRNIPKLRFICPSNDLLQIFEKYCHPMRIKVEDTHLQSNILAKIRDALLPKLLSGEIRIKDAEKFAGELV